MTEKFPWEEYIDEVEYATYDPDDDKIRIYSGRVPQEMYDALKEAKFNRAYKQGCFYAKWYPLTEDIALALCGEIVDEDTSLFERAEARYSRFAGYSSNAEYRAEQAMRAGAAAVEGIPFGQPILVGHHSEKRHRRAVEKARRAADKAVEETDRRDYWEYRAKGVLRHAKAKYNPGKISRRIKTLEADKRSFESSKGGDKFITALSWRLQDWNEEHPEIKETWPSVQAATYLKKGEVPGWSEELAERVGRWKAGRSRYCDRWIAHLEDLIGYWETIYTDVTGGEDIREQMEIKKGDWVRYGTDWGRVVRVNKARSTGLINTVSVDTSTIVPKPVYVYRKVWKWAYEGIREVKSPEEYAALTDGEVYAARMEKEQKLAEARKEREEKAADPLREAAEVYAEQASNIEVRVNHNPDFFPTPEHVARDMVNRACISGDMRLLEPSAGSGVIYRMLTRFLHVQTDWCELNQTAVEYMTTQGISTTQGYGPPIARDFMEYKPGPVYDRIVMNPPFSRYQWQKHISHAFDCLKPGGRLVAVAPGFGKRHRGSALAKKIEAAGSWEYEDLPKGTFEESGTMVYTHMLIVDKDDA